MKSYIRILCVILIFGLLQSCNSTRRSNSSRYYGVTEPVPPPVKSKISANTIPRRYINTKNIDPNSVVDFAQTLIGIKYKYGSVIKEQGFDCSGFINYVFNHFNIQVPRTTIDFTSAGTPVPLDHSRKGDLILFTGTDTTGWIVGHMGMITENENGNIHFIHSSSGKANGVIVSSLSKYYVTRFVKVIRVFP